jgi:hypothetical protein
MIVSGGHSQRDIRERFGLRADLTRGVLGLLRLRIGEVPTGRACGALRNVLPIRRLIWSMTDLRVLNHGIRDGGTGVTPVERSRV